MDWTILCDLAPRCAAAQMARDAAAARQAKPLARIFTWQPAAVSWGWKQALPEWLQALRAEPPRDLELTERPTGGGIAWHGSDVSVSVVVPRALAGLAASLDAACRSAVRLCERYGASALVQAGLPARGQPVAYCLAEPSEYAVLIGGRKVAGFAARRYPEAWLVQGSLLVQPLPTPIRSAVPDAVLARTEQAAAPLAAASISAVQPGDAARRWAAHWAAWWTASMEELALAHAV